MGSLIALAPLLIALLVVVKKGVKALKASPMTADDKEIAQDVAKAVVYIFAAAALLWWFTPSFGLGLTILWTILTVIFATVAILTVVDLPDKLDKFDDRIWADGPVTPVYSMSKAPVERIRWVRRILMAALVVIAIICATFGAITTTSASEATGDSPAAATPASPTSTPPSTSTSTSTPAPSPSASATSSAPASSAAPEEFKNTCGGPNPKKVSTTTINFKVGDKLFICKDGNWKTWAQANPSTEAPATAQLTHWIKVAEDNGYGVVAINNTPYLFWTTAIQG